MTQGNQLIERMGTYYDPKIVEYFRDLIPGIPDLVLYDFVYPEYQHDYTNIEPEIVEWLNSITWIPEKLKITIDIFDDYTQKRITDIIKGIPLSADDQRRYEKQRELLTKSGKPSELPIILTFVDGKYELQEGWHRVVESVRLWPEGFIQSSLVGYPL